MVEDDCSEALQDWRQGDFTLEVGPFLSAGYADEESEDALDVEFDDACCGFVVISQSCEIIQDTRQYPHVIVSPLIRADEQICKLAASNRRPTATVVPNAPDGTIVDLSRMMTVSKELLAKWGRHVGFNSEVDRRKFAILLERKHGRFGFPEEFNLSTVSFAKKIWEKYKKPESDIGKALRALHEIRVGCREGWESENRTIQFIFILLEDGDGPTRQELGAIFGDLVADIEWLDGYTLDSEIPFMLSKLSEMTALDYTTSVPLDLNALSFKVA